MFSASGYENPSVMYSFSPWLALTRSSGCSPVVSHDITSRSACVWEGRKRIVASLPNFCQFAQLNEGSQGNGVSQ